MPDETNPTDSAQSLDRGAMTDIAIGAGPTIAVLADQAIDAFKNRPAKEPDPPTPIVFPPGLKADD